MLGLSRHETLHTFTLTPSSKGNCTLRPIKSQNLSEAFFELELSAVLPWSAGTVTRFIILRHLTQETSERERYLSVRAVWRATMFLKQQRILRRQ